MMRYWWTIWSLVWEEYRQFMCFTMKTKRKPVQVCLFNTCPFYQAEVVNEIVGFNLLKCFLSPLNIADLSLTGTVYDVLVIVYDGYIHVYTHWNLFTDIFTYQWSKLIYGSKAMPIVAMWFDVVSDSITGKWRGLIRQFKIRDRLIWLLESFVPFCRGEAATRSCHLIAEIKMDCETISCGKRVNSLTFCQFNQKCDVFQLD